MANSSLTPAEIFDMGFQWAMDLRGQTLEDSRAVGRTLSSDLFEKISKEIHTAITEEGFNSFESSDLGIVAAKKIISKALNDHHMVSPGYKELPTNWKIVWGEPVLGFQLPNISLKETDQHDESQEDRP